VDQHVRVNLGFYTGLLAQLEAETPGADGALARIDEAFRLSEEVEHRCSLPFLHRLRGEILLKRDPSDPAPAEEAFRTSIAIAKDQSARSPVLLASLDLAKLYQSTGRPIEAHGVLAPALEGFSPTREMPQIAEAQALRAALAESEEVKAAETLRQRQLHLQTAYGQAMIWAKGFTAEETRAAFSRATELTNADDFSVRFAAASFQWILAFLRGELQSARVLGSSLLDEAERTGRVVEAGVARRGLAQTCYQAGEFLEARNHCERAIEACKLPERKGDAGTLPNRHWPDGHVNPRRNHVAIGRNQTRTRTDRPGKPAERTRPHPLNGPSALLEIPSRNPARRSRRRVERI
jgi:hypothetical protein